MNTLRGRRAKCYQHWQENVAKYENQAAEGRRSVNVAIVTKYKTKQLKGEEV